MAKILFTAIVADARNKLAGTVFSKNRYGAYMRTKVTPTNPQTLSQQSVRQQFGASSSEWRDLTEEQRQAWIGAAPDFPIIDRFGNPKILSGNSLFISLNANLALVGAPGIQDPPLPAAIPVAEITNFIVTINAGVLEVEMTGTSSATGANIKSVLRATQGFSPGKSYFTNLLRNITPGSIMASPFTQDVTPEYETIHGTPAVGSKVGLEFFLVNTDSGQAGVPLRTMAIVEDVTP